MATTDERLKALENDVAETKQKLAQVAPSTLSTDPKHLGKIPEKVDKATK
jgi:hypothetical protein